MTNPIQIGRPDDALRADRTRRMMRDEQIEAPRTESHVDKDPAAGSAAFRNSFSVPTEITTGYVVDALAYSHCYKVQLDRGTMTMPCTFMGTSANSFIGARSIATLLPGTRVWVLVHPLMSHGVIMGTEPDFAVDGQKQLGDFIALGSRVGFKVDDAHTFPMELLGGGGVSSGVTDWNSWRPFDSITSGEWGHISENGIRFFLDSFMAQVAVNEATGIFAFYIDNLLRVAGANLQVRSGGSEWEALNDQGEFLSVEGFSPYLWEALGHKKFGTVAGKDRDADETQLDEQHYAKREPIDDDLIPYHRAQFIQGYLGQGGKRQLSLFPRDLDKIRYQDAYPLPGVFSEDIALTGRYSLRSAKAISIAKRTPIQIGKRVQRPESEEGDNEKNYKFAGTDGLGSGDEHEVVDELEVVSDTDRSFLVRATGVMDAHAYTFNWEANHAFFYHKKDWHIPDEDDLELSNRAQVAIPFGALSGEQYLKAPDPVTYKVDDREGYKEAKYYPNESFFDLLEDGGIVIGDGFGSEIRMTGGSVFISAPGDVWMKSGRNTNIWAGHDFIARARNSADITATNNDVRIKSERNMQLLAGNSEKDGGLLLESRGKAAYQFSPNIGEDVISGGVMIKSTNASSIMWGKSLYLRSGVEGTGPAEFGEITLDANQGAGIIKTNSDWTEHFVRTGAYWNFATQTGEDVGEVTATYEFLATWASFPGVVAGNSHAVFNGSRAGRGWSVCVDGHFASTGACDNEHVVCLTDKYLAEWTKWIDRATWERQLIITQIGADIYKSNFTNWWYAPQQPGENKTIESVGVSMRKAAHYLTNDFTLYEDRWQRLSRITDVDVGKWEEKEVPAFFVGGGRATGLPTYPHPGKVKWKDEDRLFELTPEQTKNAGDGIRAKSMDELKDEDNFGGVKEKKLDGVYRVFNGGGGGATAVDPILPTPGA